METEEITVKTGKKQNHVLKKFCMFCVALLSCLIATASSSWMSAKGVVAVGGVPVLLNEVTQADIDDAKERRDAARAEADEASEMISQLEDQRTDLEGELSKLNEASDAQREQYVIIYGQLEAALEEKAKALDEFIVAQENLEAQQKVFTDRVTVMFEYQNKSTLEVLLESDSIAGFFTNMELITLIADADAQAIEMLQTALDDAQLQADIKLQYAEEMQAVADEKKRQLDELESLIGTTEAALDNLNTDIDSWEQQEDELEAYAESLDDEVKRLQEEYDEQQRVKYSGGNAFRWPTYNRYITSYFGYRTHPVYGTTKFHSGIDIGAGYGDTIMASCSGTVIYVTEPYEGCNKGGTGYGNYCIIDHGNGYSTLYGHARDIYVSVGDYVSAGQQIGEVGSTGTSTGAHLHFEVRVNGTQYNPEDYLP